MNISYNTQLSQVKLPEYGRFVQKLIEKALLEENDLKRQAFATQIVRLMSILSPKAKVMEDFRQKLWSHLMYISGYELKVQAPYPIRHLVNLKITEKPISYPKTLNRHKDYGKNIQVFIQKASLEKDKEKRVYMSFLVANYMKLVQKTWNNENINDIMVKRDLEHISGGKLTLEEEVNLYNHTHNTKTNVNNRNNRNNKKKYFKNKKRY